MFTDVIDPDEDCHRRLVDKINVAALHALDHDRRGIADTLRLLHDAVVEEELEEGYDDRSDDELKKWLDLRYANEKMKQRVRPRNF